MQVVSWSIELKAIEENSNEKTPKLKSPIMAKIPFPQNVLMPSEMTPEALRWNPIVKWIE